MLGRFARTYTRLTEKNPYTMNMTTGGLLWFSGDVISQKCEGRSNLDWKRIVRMTTYGFFFAGPIYYWWYSFLDRKTSALRLSMWRLISLKVFADQCIFEPPYLSFFFVTTSIMEGHGVEQTIQKIRQDIITTYFVDCAVWPVAQMFNFRFFPVIYQPLFVNTMCVGWNAYLSFVKHKSIEPTLGEKNFEI